MPAIAPLPSSSAKLDLDKLSKEEKLAASAYVLSRKDIPLPPAPTLKDTFAWAKDDVMRSIERIKKGEPHRFANLFGSLGGMGGAVTGAAIGRLLGERQAWATVLAGAVIGTYPPALAGFLLDKVVDR